MLAQVCQSGGILRPLGAATELAVALALRGFGSAEPWVGRLRSKTRASLVVTAIGAFLSTFWLSPTGLGEGSLLKDLDIAHQSPNEVFQFRRSMGKVWACAMTIGFPFRLMVRGLLGRFFRPLGLVAQIQAPDWSRSR